MSPEPSPPRPSMPPLAALVSLVGAVLYGRRTEDARARKKVAAYTATSFLVFFGYEAVSFGQEWIRHEWQAAADRQKELVGVVQVLSTDIRDLTKQLRSDSIQDATFRATLMRGSHERQR